jgi:hypothetical protein
MQRSTHPTQTQDVRHSATQKMSDQTERQIGEWQQKQNRAQIDE